MKPVDRKRRNARSGEPHKKPPEERAAELETKALQIPLAEIGLPTRVVNTLEEYDMILCAHLMARSRESLLNIPGITPRTIKDIAKAVHLLGLSPPADWIIK